MDRIHEKWCKIAYENGYDGWWYEEQDVDGNWYESIIRKEPSVGYLEYYIDVIEGYVDDDAITVASSVGKLNIIKMLISRGFKPKEQAIEFAYTNNKIECLEYLIGINSPCNYQYIKNISCDDDIDCMCVKMLDDYALILT